MKIWVVTEYILKEESSFGQENNQAFYSSKEKAIAAVYEYLRNNFSELDIHHRVRLEEEGEEVSIYTECGNDYGMYDCRYDIEPTILDKEFGEFGE